MKEQQNTNRQTSWSDALEEVLAFAGNLTKLFALDDPQIKRQVLSILGSNLIIKDRTVRIDAKNAFVFLKQVEKRVIEENVWLEPKKSLQQQPHPAFLQIHSDLERESVLCSNLKESITPELTLQIKMLKELMARRSLV